MNVEKMVMNPNATFIPIKEFSIMRKIFLKDIGASRGMKFEKKVPRVKKLMEAIINNAINNTFSSFISIFRLVIFSGFIK